METNHDKCFCATCKRPDLMSIINKDYEKKILQKKKDLDSSDAVIVDLTTGDYNYWNGNIYYGSNNNYTWTIELKNIYNGSTLTDYTITDENIQDIEAIFQIWDDILVDNMLGYDSNGNKIKINVDFGFEDMLPLGSVIAYASQFGATTKKQENGVDVWESGHVFTNAGYTNMNTRFLDGYYGTPFDQRNYDINSNYPPIYLPRTGVNVQQNEYIRVMVHEVGHIMMLVCTQGPGRSVYDNVNRVYRTIQNIPYVRYTDPTDQRFKYYWGGASASRFYKKYFENESLLGPPVEDMSGPYTIDGQSVYINRHWEESGNRSIPNSSGSIIVHPYMDRELMTPYHDSGSQGIAFSLICIGYLEDCGYKYVNYFKADPYPNNRSGITNLKTPQEIVDLTTYYVRINPNGAFNNPHYVFSTTPNGTALNGANVNLPLQKTVSYKILRSEPSGTNAHPFNVGTSWRVNDTSIAVTGNGTGSVVQNSLGTSSAASLKNNGEHLYFTIPSGFGNASEFFKYFCYAHSSMIEYFAIDSAPCFDESTKILCMKNNKEKYIPVSELKKGDLVVTYKNGVRPISKIANRTQIFNVDNDYKETMYCMKKHGNMIDDLKVTGRHSILVNDWSTHNTVSSRTNKPHSYIEDKALLGAAYCNMFEVETKPTKHTIYHIALEGEKRRYGIYANGALMESWDNKCKNRLLH